MNRADDPRRKSCRALSMALVNAGAVRKGDSTWLCPYHDDKHPSAGIYANGHGVWRFRCHACGAGGDVYDIEEGIVSPGRTYLVKHPEVPPKTYPSVEAVIEAVPGKLDGLYRYGYPDSRGLAGISFVVLRMLQADGTKRYFPVTGTGKGEQICAPKSPWALYKVTTTQATNRVIVVEGEKCVDALWDVGLCATTSPFGANSAAKADWSPLAGKEVYLWPDNDANGQKYIKDVITELRKLDPRPSMRLVQPFEWGLKEKEDVADLLEQLKCSDEEKKKHILRLLAKLDKYGGLRADHSIDDHMLRRIEAMKDGTWRTHDWPWHELGYLTHALSPGTITLIAGDSGATKSFFLLEAVAWWYEQGIKVALYELEEDRTYHLFRALAQRIGNVNILNDTWVREHPEELAASYADESDFLERLGNCMTDAPQEPVSQKQLIDWATHRAEEGCRIIAIDPITAASVQGNQWDADKNLMTKLKIVGRNYGCSMILVTHPAKGRKGSLHLDDISGGAAFQRFAQTIFWIEYHSEKEVPIYQCTGGTYKEKVNRTIHILKARNGPGAGIKLGFTFDNKTLRFKEHGAILTEGKK